jgi:hypothetical protein
VQSRRLVYEDFDMFLGTLGRDFRWNGARPLNGGTGADRECGPLGDYARPIMTSGCSSPPSHRSGGSSHTAEMMPCDETRGPLFTGRGRAPGFGWRHATTRPFGPGIRMASSATEPLWGRNMDGVMLHRRPFGPGIWMASSATEPLRGRNMDGVMLHRRPFGPG